MKLRKKMKKYILIIISLALVLVMVAGCGSQGGKKFDSDDEWSPEVQDDADVEDDADDGPDSDEEQTEDTDTEDTDTGDTDTGDTQGNESNPATSPVGINGTIVGVWNNWKDDWQTVLPASYAQKFLNADMTDSAVALALVDEIKGNVAITGSVFVYVYRQDGTGFTFFVAESDYGWETYNYRVEGDTLHKTDRIYTSQSDDPDFTYQDKPFDDESNEFRLSVYDGKEILFVMRNIPESSDLAALTIDEYIEWMHEKEWRVRLG